MSKPGSPEGDKPAPELAVHPEVSHPDDLDLDISLHSLELRTLLAHENSVIIELAGGQGWWNDENGKRVENITNATLSVTATWQASPLVAQIVTRLRGWEKTKTPLSFVWAVGRLGRLYDGEANEIPMPVRSYPPAELASERGL